MVSRSHAAGRTCRAILVHAFAVSTLEGSLGQTHAEKPAHEDVRRRAEQQRAVLDRRRRVRQHRIRT